MWWKFPGRTAPKRNKDGGQARGGRFLRDRRGGVASELGILLIPFSVIVFATLENCVSFAAQEMLANATDDVARMMRTGQVRSKDITEASLKTMICDRIRVVIPTGCPGLKVELKSYTTFAEAAAVRVTISNGTVNTSGTPTLGGPGTKNMLRVFYEWPVMTNIIATNITGGGLSGSKTLHFASVTWQNEEFDN